MNKIIISLTAGIILGMLYAPAKGSDSRNKLARLGSDIKEGWNDLADSLAAKVDGIKESVDDMANKTVVTIEETRFEV